MSIGNWDPTQTNDTTTYTINSDLLTKFADLSAQDRLGNLTQALSDDEKQQHTALMHQTSPAWEKATRDFDNQSLLDLIRFFTIAEHLPGWEAGAESPVIFLTKLLKQRGVALDKETLRWIKANSENRYLPHGPLL